MQSQNPNSFQSIHSRWTAVTHRTPSSHSSFLYGVKSTKIYCRPTCSARLARRVNIIFYDTVDQARRDGFRPCKRCKPDNAEFKGEKEEVVTSIIALLRAQKDNDTVKRGLKGLAQEVGVTPSYLCRVFKKTMGVTIGTYATEFEKAQTDHNTERSDKETERLKSLITASPAPVVDGFNGDLVLTREKEVGTVEDAVDLNFNLDDWFWTDQYLNDSFYGR